MKPDPSMVSAWCVFSTAVPANAQDGGILGSLLRALTKPSGYAPQVDVDRSIVMSAVVAMFAVFSGSPFAQ
jgi:hypothetical protein